MTRLATAQSILGRLEEQIRKQVGQGSDAARSGGASGASAVAVPPGAKPRTGGRPYLGAVVDDRNDRGRGVRVLSVRPGGPADQAGLRPQDLIVGAASSRVRQMMDLTAILGLFSPGDKLALEVNREGRPLRLDITLGVAPTAGAPGDGLPEAIPPPPAEAVPAEAPRPPQPNPPSAAITAKSPVEGPMLTSPPADLPRTADSASRIDQLQRRIDELERRVQELERALSESRKK